MALSGEKQYYTFVKGLITEASPLTFPENASLDEDNFVLERTGARSRRLGVDYEVGYSLKPTGFSTEILADAKISFHRWDTPNGNTNISIGVVRVKDSLWFVNLLAEAPSNAFLNSGNPVVLTGLDSADIDTTVVSNKFIIASEELAKPVVLTYDDILDVVSDTTITVEVRDFWGIYENVADTDRPTTLTDIHKYNLRNQNWTNADITSTFTSNAYYPSNADIWFLARFSDPTNANYNSYNAAALARNNTYSARAPRGAVVLDAFFRGNSRETYSGLSTLPADTENGAFSTVTSYAGRLFYSGVESSVSDGDLSSPNYSGYVFFSQVIVAQDQFGKCYQVNDPTAEDISDVVASDGGTIQIPEATKIIKLLPSKGSVMVFAENGIWEIYGSGSGFTATSYQLSKVSGIGVLSKDSIVEVNGSFLVWTNAGIFLVNEDQVSGRYKAENISLNSIQTYYNSISDIAKRNVKSYFNERENKVRWLFNDTEDYGVGSSLNIYNKELILDLTLNAFYTHSYENLEGTSPLITGYVSYPGITVFSDDVAIYAGNEVVEVTSTDTVVVNSDIAQARGSQFGFLTLYNTSFTISKLLNTTFVDWFTADGQGISYSSYLVTGYEITGDATRNKQVPYMFCYFEKTETGFTETNGVLDLDNQSSCLVQAQWNWANSAAGGKWGTQFQAYRFKRPYFPTGALDNFDTGDRVVVSKSKLRGRGRALSLKIESEAGKDMRILGWSLRMTADQS
jgi:hypothetical protein